MLDLLYELAGSEAYYSFYFIKLFIYLLFGCVCMPLRIKLNTSNMLNNTLPWSHTPALGCGFDFTPLTTASEHLWRELISHQPVL